MDYLIGELEQEAKDPIIRLFGKIVIEKEGLLWIRLIGGAVSAIFAAFK